VLRDIAARAAGLGVGAIAVKEAIAALAFEGALRCYLGMDQFVRDGVRFQVLDGPSLVVKATYGDADAQGIALADVEAAKLVVFARVLPGVEAQGIKNFVELRGFVSRNEIRKHYRVTKYKTVPGYRVGVKRFKPITDLLWWVQDMYSDGKVNAAN
jgi:hypothetical protein